MTRTTIVARSWCDRGSIAAQSGRNLWPFQRKIEANLWPIRGQSRSYDVAPRNCSHDPCKPPSRSPPSPTISSLIFPLKACIPLFCSSTFDQFMKELSKFRGRSLVHRDPPAFRLNSEGIGAGLITNSSLISLNFPHEFRKSVGKDPRKFTPIRANWSLILVAMGLVVRFDWLSGGNLSFY